jgi:RNA polymerase sigma-70 factor (ECF subfamily)
VKVEAAASMPPSATTEDAEYEMRARFCGDVELVRRLTKGEEDAFREFFDEYSGRLYRFAIVRLGGDPDAAEEVVQACLVQVMRKLATYRGEAALFSWLCTFCRHEISRFLAKRKKANVMVSLAEDHPEARAVLESLLAAEGNAEDAVYRQEIAHLVHITLDHLPARYGNALEWKYTEGLSLKQVGDRLGISARAAESLLRRARTAFREGFCSLVRFGRDQPQCR